MRIFQADYLFPGAGPPIPDGAVALDARGHVRSVGSLGRVRAEVGQEAPLQRLQGGLCPGFVNAHVHLELSALEGCVPQGTGLVGFIRQVQAERGRVSPEAEERAVRKAVRALVDEGTVAVGDIGNGTTAYPILVECGLQGHFFLERFGFDPARAEALRRNARESLEALPAAPGLTTGPTPHAVYSTSPPLIRALLAENEAQKRPTTIHLLESRAERELFEEKRGPFVPFLESVGLDLGGWVAPARSPLDVLLDVRGAGEGALQVVHMTDATGAEIERLRTVREVWVCLCPGANAYIERRVPPVEALWRAGLRLTVGTDSLASNTALSMAAELVRLKQTAPGIPTEIFLEWATIGGAGLLGQAHTLGTLEPGKRPGLVHLALPGPPPGPDVLAYPGLRARRVALKA